MTRTGLFIFAGCMAVLAVIAPFAERRRAARRDLDQVGWVPWTTVQVIALTLTAVSIGFALKL